MRPVVIHPRTGETMKFLPGDKVCDRRDVKRRVWRVTECRPDALFIDRISLRSVDEPSDERRWLRADSIVPYLEMVAPAIYQD